MDSDQWVWDDPEIDDADYLYRRIKRADNIVAIDPMTKQAQLLPLAFKYDEGSGVSLCVGSLAERANMQIANFASWETHALAYVTAQVPRTSETGERTGFSGVVPDPIEENAAHGLVRVQSTAAVRSQEHRRQWLPVRSRLLELASYVSDLASVDGTPTSPRCITS